MKKILTMAAVLAMFSTPAMAQMWTEVGDAPEGVPGRQDTLGVGPLTSIVGQINRGVGDHTDTYSIIVTDVQQFYATTKSFFGGTATTATGGVADTRLWLWDELGNPLIANDDVNDASLGTTDNLRSFISDPSTFTANTGEVVAPTATGISLVAGQKYLLSISLFSNDPDDAGGVDIFSLGSDFDALHGPNTAAGPFAGWENGASTTVADYTIALRGATFCAVPEPASLALISIGAIALLRRRR